MQTFDAAVQLAKHLPGVAVGTSYGTPALKASTKTFARMWDDGETLVLKVPLVVRDHLLASAPAKYFVTPHYHGYPAVLVRLAQVSPADLTPLLEEAWRQVASPRLVRQLNEETPR